MIVNINKGDIIRVNKNIYIEYPGGAWYDHFVIKAILYKVKTEPTNNGNFIAVTSTGEIEHFNTIYNDIIEVIKAA